MTAAADARPALATPTFRCLGFSFCVASEVPELVAHLEQVFAPFTVSGPAPHRYVVSCDRDGFVLVLDGVELLRTDMPAVLSNYLVWDVNQRVVAATPDRLLIHAGAVAAHDRAALLVGPSGAGKSTLVAGLVRSGLRYLTDELVAVDPSTGRLDPYPRAISLGVGVWDEFRTAIDPGEPFGGGDERHVTPDRLRSGCLATEPAVPRVIVSIRYEADARLRCIELERADAVVLLARQTFGFDGSMLEPLAAVVAETRCFSLVSGRLADACVAVSGMLLGVCGGAG